MDADRPSSSAAASGGGVGFLGLLAIVLITLKLCGIIRFSWWWVLSPLWGPIAISIAFLLLLIAAGIVILGIAGIVMLIAYLVQRHDERQLLKHRQERAERLAAVRASPVQIVVEGGAGKKHEPYSVHHDQQPGSTGRRYE